jgi:hypothetical protein
MLGFLVLTTFVILNLKKNMGSNQFKLELNQNLGSGSGFRQELEQNQKFSSGFRQELELNQKFSSGFRKICR